METIRNTSMSELHNELQAHFNEYLEQSEKFDEKGVKGASSKARKALSEFTKVAKTRRAEIQEKRNAM